MQGRVVIVGDGKNSDFLQDKWCGNFSLCEKFHGLYDVCNKKKITVDTMNARGLETHIQAMAV